MRDLGKRIGIRSACGGGAIFNIVGLTKIDVGRMTRADNVEGGSSREGRAEGRGYTDTLETGTLRKTGYDAVATDGGVMNISIEYCVT